MKAQKTNKFVIWGAAILALLIVLGCGGGGGGTGGGGGGGGGGVNPSTAAKPAGQYLEFFRGPTLVDPMNLVVGDSIVIQFVNYDIVGNRTVLTASGWSLSGPGAGTVMTINSGGLLSINSQPSGYITVSASATVSGQPKTLMQDIFVPTAVGTRISGRLKATTTQVPVTGVQIEFINSGGDVVGGAVSDAVGNFNGLTLNTAVSLRLKPSTVPAAYFAAIKYQNVNYAVTGTACLLPVPTIIPGSTVSFASTIFIPRQADGPPPPPSGCSN
ncbi:MAG: hypothetical protein KF836_05740 [Fimbriimonadaceae bacterium]|nr:hypothetical protein [Fimbriimonadaceae bacterium]